MTTNADSTITLTSAEAEFIQWLRRQDANAVYEDLHTVITLCIGNYLSPGHPGGAATQPALEAWLGMLETMRFVHLVSLGHG